MEVWGGGLMARGDMRREVEARLRGFGRGGGGFGV